MPAAIIWAVRLFNVALNALNLWWFSKMVTKAMGGCPGACSLPLPAARKVPAGHKARGLGPRQA